MKLPLIKKKQLAPGVWEFNFGLNGKKFDFIAGQYVRVVVPRLLKEDTKGPGRVFSIASSPGDKKKLTIVFRVSPSGYKQTLVRTPVGAALEIEGPWGTLRLPEKNAKPVVLIAGGIGITPFLSMLLSIGEKEIKRDITLLYAFKDAENALYLRDLKRLEKNNFRLRIVANIGEIDRKFIQKNIPPEKQQKSLFYISGPIPMMDAVIKLLYGEGITDSQIYFEEWSQYVFDRIPKEIIKPTTDAVIFTDLNGFFRYVNPAWEKLTGWKRDEVIDKRTPRIGKSGIQDQAFYEEIWNIALSGIAYEFEAVNKKKDETLYTVDEVSVPLKSKSGCIYGQAAFQRDVTTQRKTEQDLKLLTKNLDERVKEQTKLIINDKLRNDAIIQSIGEGLAVVDGEMKTILINQAAEDILGFTEKEVLGKVWPRVVNTGTDKISKLPLNKSPLAKAIKGKAIISTVAGPVTYYYQRKDKTRIPVSIVATPILLEGKITGSIVVFRDITKEKELDKAKIEFVSLASHQLRTPATAIQWLVERFLKIQELGSQGEELMNDILRSAKRLNTLISLLLDASRLEMGKVAVSPKHLELVEFINSYIKECEPLVAKKNLKLSLGKHPTELDILTDHVGLRNIVSALVTNAIEYTPDKGTVEISIEKKPKSFVLAVRDTGIGIPETEKSNIFERFFRASNAVIVKPDGSGLGLYIVFETAKLLGGKVWFESELNKGTVFYAELPMEVKQKAGGLVAGIDSRYH